MTFAEHVEDGVMHLSDLHNKKVGDLIDFVHTRSDIEEFDLGDHDTIALPIIVQKGHKKEESTA